MDLDPWVFWRETLKSPKFVTAPMVDYSELPFRALTRNYSSDLCYTPMLHAARFSSEESYRRINFSTHQDLDYPLITQFCANDPDILIKAATLVQNNCQAVDLNLGCPQRIAKRGNYGAFLATNLPLVEKLVNKTALSLQIPLTCKIRIFEDVDATLRYAKIIEKAGAKVLTVHGRTITQKGQNAGLADWDVIRLIKNTVSIPVIANGNVLNLEDANQCLIYTKADAVMSAEAILHNPALFSDLNPPCWDIAEEFLQLCKRYPINLNHIRGHLFKIFHYILGEHTELREVLTNSYSITELSLFVKSIKELYQNKSMEKTKANAFKNDLKDFKEDRYKLSSNYFDFESVPVWKCQYRPTNLANSNSTLSTTNPSKVKLKKSEKKLLRKEKRKLAHVAYKK